MTIQEIYELAVQKAIAADVRGKKRIEKILKDKKTQYRNLSADQKALFDQMSLTNPYADSRILYGNPKKQVKNVMVGIDITPAELILADRLNEKKQAKIDLVISHHPQGIALAGLADVMDMQEDLMYNLGVPINVMEKIMEPRINEIRRAVHPINVNQSVDAARLLDIPFMCMHTVADNLVYQFITNLVQKNKTKLETLQDVINMLNKIPEYHESNKSKNGPLIFFGSKNSRAGKIVATEMTGGTAGAKEMYEELNRAGVGTVLSMHMSEAYKKEAEKNHINAIVCGHIASDSLGVNQIMDELEKRGVKIIAAGGFIRVSRVKKER